MNIFDQIAAAARNYIGGNQNLSTLGNTQPVNTGGSGVSPSPSPQPGTPPVSAGGTQSVEPGQPLPMTVGGSGVFGSGTGNFGTVNLANPTPPQNAAATQQQANAITAPNGAPNILQRIIAQTQPGAAQPGSATGYTNPFVSNPLTPTEVPY